MVVPSLPRFKLLLPVKVSGVPVRIDKNARNLPASDDLSRNAFGQEMLAFAEGQFVDVALNEIQRAVEIRPGVVPAKALAGIEIEPAIVAALEVHGLLPGERRGQTEAADEPPVELDLQ